MAKNKRLIVICGPTATGKTSLAIKLAKKFNGELVSADSRQVYKEMDIGTGKDHPRTVTIHLVDIVNPDEKFSVVQYVELASKSIEKIWQRRKLPILVGGTGFYIKALVDGIETIGVSPDWELRKKLQNSKLPKLQEMLRKLNPERWKRMNKSDKNNPRRLIRAIEIAMKTKNSKLKTRKFGFAEDSFGMYNSKLKTKNLLMIGLKAPNEILYQRIDKRVDERVKQGVIDEIKKLLSRNYSWHNSALGETIGYKEWKRYFTGEANLEETIQRWQYDEHQYARRQMTWFKRDKRINWFKITEKDLEKNLLKLVKAWYSKKNAQKN